MTFAHLAEPPGLDLGHGQHPSGGWLHKADEGQAGSHAWREHVFVQLSKNKNDERVNERTWGWGGVGVEGEGGASPSENPSKQTINKKLI